MQVDDFVWTPKKLGRVLGFSLPDGRSVPQVKSDAGEARSVVVMLERDGMETFSLAEVDQIRFRKGDRVKTPLDPSRGDSPEVFGIVVEAGEVVNGEQELLISPDGTEELVQRLNKSVKHRFGIAS